MISYNNFVQQKTNLLNRLEPLLKENIITLIKSDDINNLYIKTVRNGYFLGHAITSEELLDICDDALLKFLAQLNDYDFSVKSGMLGVCKELMMLKNLDFIENENGFLFIQYYLSALKSVNFGNITDVCESLIILSKEFGSNNSNIEIETEILHDLIFTAFEKLQDELDIIGNIDRVALEILIGTKHGLSNLENHFKKFAVFNIFIDFMENNNRFSLLARNTKHRLVKILSKICNYWFDLVKLINIDDDILNISAILYKSSYEITLDKMKFKNEINNLFQNLEAHISNIRKTGEDRQFFILNHLIYFLDKDFEINNSLLNYFSIFLKNTKLKNLKTEPKKINLYLESILLIKS